MANTLLSLGLLNGDDLAALDRSVVVLAWLATIVSTTLLRLLYRRLLSALRARHRPPGAC
ncbi:MAG: hypothetical protein U0Z44_01170 [Kouleothrix sp.]